jgi:dihydropteroate synthase
MIPDIMGIVNVTPDSFSDGGHFLDPETAIAHGLQLLKEGASILDIGGESTRPGAEEISTAEEIRRVIPVITELRKHTDRISIDSYRPATLEAALSAGATMINDITALTDPDNLSIAAAAQVPVCLMHMQGTPKTMQASPAYHDVVADIFEYLRNRIEVCLTAGIKQNNIIVDVGIGFGKTLEHNITLLKNLERFHDLNVKLLLGVSRKSFIGKICPEAGTDQRLPGSLAGALRGYEAGAQIVRVHDVAATRQAFAVWDKIRPAS